MTDKPVIRINLDDSELVAFQRKWDKYQQKLAEISPAWGDVADLQESASDKFDQMRLAGNLIHSASGAGAANIHSTIASFSLISDAWMYIYRGGRKFRDNIQEGTQHLRRWERMTGVFAALVGAGGLYGIGRLASGAAARRQEAAGLGVPYGDLTSAQVSFGRLGNVEGIIHGFNQALMDIRSPALHSLGVYGEVRGMTAADAFAKSLPRIKQILDRTDPRNLANVVRGYGMDQLGIDVQTARLIQRMQPEEIDRIGRDYERNKNPLGLPDDIARKWQDFTTQMDRAREHIRSALSRNLVKLAKPLTHLSDSILNLIDTFVSTQGDRANELLDKVGGAFEKFGKWLGSDGVQKDLKDFEEKFDLTKKQFDDLNSWLGSHGDLLKWIGGAALAFRLGGPAGVAAYALGTTLMPQPLNPGEDERRRQQQYGQERRTPGGLIGMRHAAQEQKEEHKAEIRRIFGHPHSGKVVGAVDAGTGAHGQHLVSMTDGEGHHYTVNAEHAEAFAGLVKDLEAEGYHIKSISGYNNRRNVNNPSVFSEHAFGNAIDINPAQNPNSPNLVTDMPPNIRELAHRHGLRWGGDFSRMKDAMHFEYNSAIDEEAKKEQPHITIKHYPPQWHVMSTREKFINWQEKHSKRAIFGHPHLAGRKPQQVHVMDNTGGSVAITGGGF